ncbi:Hemopexin-like domain-containing protein [Rhizoctonia solani]|nr:Hemopexin-like domain-containing protein [Rhizoctonia solani]
MVGFAFLNITGRDESYVFQGDRYIRYQWTPGTGNDKITYGPTETHKEWASLKEAGFNYIDAILPIPGHDHRAYFFCGDKYARIEYVPGAPGDKILGGVRSVHENWASIKKAGFTSIDGALPVPGRPNEVYIFSGPQYCRIRYTELKNDDELLDGPKPITVGWSVLGFDSIDTVFARPGTERGAYFFNGAEYCQLNVVVGGKDEHVSGPREIASYWPGLVKAGFY